MIDRLMICEKQLIESNDRAEAIIAERETTIARYRDGINEILDAVRPIDEDGDDAKRWNWMIRKLADI